MEKVLITGASGFIGRAITTLASMEEDWEVYGLVSGRNPPPPQTPDSYCNS